MREFFKKLKSALLYAFFPNKCVFCDKIIGVEGSCCTECEKTLPYVRAQICPKCGKDDCICAKEKFAFDELTVPFYYDKQVRRSILRFKFQNAPYYARSYACFIARRLINSQLAAKAELITFVPLYKSDKRSRGYDQAQKIAQELSKITEIPCERLLIKLRKTKKQHDLSAKERRKNLKGVFTVCGQEDVKGKTIILCDDVMTTGSTLNETAKELKKAGAEAVVCCTVATAYCRNGIFMAEYK